MKIDVCVPEHWHEMNVGWEDIAAAIHFSMKARNDETILDESILQAINDCYQMLRAIPDKFIADHMTEGQRKIIAEALHGQADRFEVRCE